MKINRTKAIFLFIFMPKRFNDMAVKYHEQYILNTNKKLNTSRYNFDREREGKSNADQATKLRVSLSSSAAIIFIALITSVMLSYQLVTHNYLSSSFSVMVFLLLGGYTILAVTLWQISNAASASGEWLAEKVHNWIFKSLYCLGTFFLGIGVGIDGFINILQP